MSMKRIVPYANARTITLECLIKEHVTPHAAAFEVSDPKRDGTVIVRFRSTSMVPATFLVERMVRHLTSAGIQHRQTSPTHVRLPLDSLTMSGSSVTVVDHG